MVAGKEKRKEIDPMKRKGKDGKTSSVADSNTILTKYVVILALFSLALACGIAARRNVGASSFFLFGAFEGNAYDTYYKSAIFRWQDPSRRERAKPLPDLNRTGICPKRRQTKPGEEEKPVGIDLARKRAPKIFEAPGCLSWWKHIERNDIREFQEPNLARMRLMEARILENATRFQLRNHPNRSHLRTVYGRDANLIDGSSERGYTLVNTTMDTFFELPSRWKARSSTKGSTFGAQCSNSIEGSQIEAEFTAVGKTVLEFALDETAKASRFGLKQTDIGTKTVLWLNTKGTESGIHFDRTHNFVVQLDGHKRWTLYPPSEWVDLEFFPFMHENYDTSRLTGTAEEASARASEGRAAPRSVTVDTFAGDVLYLPPLWSTRVVTVRDSAHLSINSPSLEQMMWAKAYWRLKSSPPFRDEWTVPQRVAAMWGLLNALVDAFGIVTNAVTSSLTSEDFLRVGLGSRYERLAREKFEQRESVGRRDMGSVEIEAEDSFVCRPSEFRASEDLMQEYAVVAAEMAMDLAEIARPVVHINLLDLSEELIMEALRTSRTETLVDFVSICLLS
eukprot:g1866.t1